EATEDVFHQFWDDTISAVLTCFLPDYGFSLSNLFIFRGEEKSELSNDDPKIELGYYAFGAQVILVAICPPSRDGDKNPVVVDIVKSDLQQVKDRVCHLQRMMNISRLLETNV
ncbi:4544_t:CDS:2, partial [Paraglomus brasilianum]